MSRRDSGRIVIELDPMVKRQLHAAVALRGQTLKDWFLECARDLLDSGDLSNLADDHGTRIQLKEGED